MQGKNKEEALQKKALLRSIPMFAGRTEEQIHNTTLFMFSRRYDKDAVIAREGELCENIYFVDTGEVEFRQDVEVLLTLATLFLVLSVCAYACVCLSVCLSLSVSLSLSLSLSRWGSGRRRPIQPA